MLTYTLISEVFAQQLQLRTTLRDAFWEGTLVIRFLRPMGLVRQLSAEMLGRWAMFAANVLASIAIVLAVEYTWGSLAFWAPRAAEEINSDSWRLLTQLAPFPLDGLAGLALVSLVTIVPVGLVAWYPSRALLGIDSPVWAAELALTLSAVAFAALAVWLFTRGLRHYGHTGSTRYLDYGHRR